MDSHVELFDDAVDSRWITRLKDSDGRFYMPFPRAAYETPNVHLKDGLRALYTQLPDSDPEIFDDIWPHLWKLQYNRKAHDPATQTLAVLDTGVMLEHPVIQQVIWKALDVTGQGPEDINGHGTAMALLACMTSVVPLNLISIKVVNEGGHGSSSHLIEGINLLIDLKRRENLETLTVNLSLGTYSKKWGLWECNGTCDVCLAAVNAAENGIIVVAAVGNQRNKTACPAMAGMKNTDIGIIPVSASDSKYSGIGETSMPSNFYFLPVNRGNP